MAEPEITLTFEEWVGRIEDGPEPTEDDYGRTDDGEVLDTLEKVQKVLEQHRRRQERLAPGVGHRPVTEVRQGLRSRTVGSPKN